MFEVNAGYTADFSVSAEITNGISADQDHFRRQEVGRGERLADILRQPAGEPDPPRPHLAGARLRRHPRLPPAQGYRSSFTTPVGVSADLEPYLELSGSAQLNPPQWDLGLYAGLDSTIGLDLSFWDDSLGDLPSITLNLIPQQTLWHDFRSAQPAHSAADHGAAQQPNRVCRLDGLILCSGPGKRAVKLLLVQERPASHRRHPHHRFGQQHVAHRQCAEQRRGQLHRACQQPGRLVEQRQRGVDGSDAATAVALALVWSGFRLAPSSWAARPVRRSEIQMKRSTR